MVHNFLYNQTTAQNHFLFEGNCQSYKKIDTILHIYSHKNQV